MYKFPDIFIKKDRVLPTKSQMTTIFFASFMMIVIGGAFLNISGQYINSGTIALIMGSIPLWMVIVSWLLGYDARPSFSVVVGLIGGFLGVGVLAVSTGVHGGNDAVMGIIVLGVFGILFDKILLVVEMRLTRWK